MQQTTSIVGKIGNINKKNTAFLVKAYLENDPELKISECLADSNGYFQVVLPNNGSYILKIDYTFNNTFMEYDEPLSYDEKLINPIKVTEGEITNVKEVYGSLQDVYAAKVISYINYESNITFTVEVRQESGVKTGFFIDTRSKSEAILEYSNIVFKTMKTTHSSEYSSQSKNNSGIEYIYDCLVKNENISFIVIPADERFMIDKGNKSYIVGNPAYGIGGFVYILDNNGKAHKLD